MFIDRRTQRPRIKINSQTHESNILQIIEKKDIIFDEICHFDDIDSGTT